MEISSSNDGLLTNIEVFDLIEARRQLRADNRTIAIELQNREKIEMQVDFHFVIFNSARINISE